jgi:hypothetical protein
VTPDGRSKRLGATAWSLRHQLAVVAVAVAAHGLLLINNGILWDDWVCYIHISRGDWQALNEWIPQMGGLPTYLYVWLAAAALPPQLVGFRILALILLVGSALLIYEIGVLSQLLGRLEAMLIAILAVSYPADHTHVMLITVNYPFFYFVFFVAVLLLLRAETATGLPRRALQVGGSLLLFLSFSLNSLLVFFAGFLLLGLLYLRHAGRLQTGPAALREARDHAYLLFIPLLYWLVYRAFYPPNGVFSHYHQFNWSLSSLIQTGKAFWSAGVVAQFRDSIDMVALVPLIALLVLALLWWIWPRLAPAFVRHSRPWTMLAFGVVLAGLAVFPYMAVGLSPTDAGWNSRHTILLALPVAIVLVAGAELLFARPDGRLGVLGVGILAVLVLGFILDSGKTYIGWEARWIKDSSVMANLKATPGAGGYSVYWIDDEYVVGGEPTYRFYEWAGMFRTIFGGETRIGLDRRAYAPSFLDTGRPNFTDIYNLAAFDPRGCEAVVTISRGDQSYGDAGLVARYLWDGIVDPAARRRLLQDVTAVTVQPYASPEATDCAAT